MPIRPNQPKLSESEQLLRMLADQRGTLLRTVRELDHEQATRRTTASDLTLASIIKHVTGVEEGWVRVMTGGTLIPGGVDAADFEWEDEWALKEDETLPALLESYERQAEATERAVAGLESLEVTATLPPAPWEPETLTWTAREILLWMMRETAQHAGHADIIRESLDGATTMKMDPSEFPTA